MRPPAARLLVVAVAAFSCLSAIVPAPAQAEEPAPAQGEDPSGRDHLAVLPGAETLPIAGSRTTGRLLVKFHRGVTSRERAATLDDAGAVPAERHAGFLEVKVDDPADALRDLAREESVRWVEPEVVLERMADFPQPERAELAIPQAQGVAEARGETFDGAGATVVVIDDGIDANNPDLVGRVSAGGSACATDALTPSGWHGTAVAALAAAADDGQNLTGAAPAASIRSYKVFCSVDGGAASSAVADALAEVARDMRAAIAAGGIPWVVNMSLGDRFESRAVQDGVDAVTAAGGTVVAAAGNDGGEQPNFPAGGRHVLSVGATELREGAWRVAPFSTGGAVDVLAPGGDIATWYRGGIRRMTGTSFAAPQVAGVVAALLAKGVGGSAVRALLAATTSAAHPGARYAAANGTGRVNAFRAYQTWVEGRSFSAAFPVGGSVLPTGGHATVSVEVLRYDPDPGGGHDAPAPVRASTSRILVTSDTSSLRGAGPSSVDGRGGILRQQRGTVRTVALPEGADGWIASAWKEDVAHRHPIHVVAKSNSPYGYRVQPGETAASTLRYGLRSQLVTKIGAFAGETVKVSATAPPGVGLGSPSAPAALCVWEPWDVNGDGIIQSPGADEDTQANFLPYGCYEGSGSRATFSFRAPETGVYLIGIVTASGGANGAYSIRTVVRTPRAAVRAPAYALPTRIADGYGYHYRLAAASLAQRVRGFEVQSSYRRRTASGTWVNAPWRAAGRFPSTHPVSPLLSSARPGVTYLLRARVVDRVGNVGAWSSVARTDVPVDDTSRALVSTSNIQRLSCPVDRARGTRPCYGPSVIGNTRKGFARTFSLRMTTDTRRYGVIATKCPRCGALRISVDGRHRATVSLRSSTTRYRQMVYSSGLLSTTPRRHRLELRAVTTPARYVIQVDGIRLTR